MTKRAIFYARVSGDDRKNATSSIEGQLAECRKYAAHHGYSLVQEVFEDPNLHTSGADWLPELDKLIRLAPSGIYDVLVCREVDRLARNRFKQLATEIELERHGVAVEYAVGQYEDSDEGRLLKGLVSEFAEYERGKIRRRTTSGKLRSVEAGNVTIGGSVAPYGYDPIIVNGQRVLVINKQEAEVVGLIFDLYAVKLSSLYEVVDYLSKNKVPLPSKGNNHRKLRKLTTWFVGTIGSILNNETYTGRWHYRKTKSIKDPLTGKSRSVPRPREEWIEIRVPAIVSDELFAAVQYRRAANKLQKGRQRKHEYTLGGMLKCGHCGNNISGVTKVDRGHEYPYYKCNAHHLPKKYGFRCDNAQFKAGSVEAAAWGWIKSLLLDPVVLRAAITDYQQKQLDRVQPQLSMLESSQTRLEELEAQNTRLIDAYTKGVLTIDELAHKKSGLDKDVAELSKVIASLRAEAEPQILTAKHVETIEAIAAEVCAGASIIGDNKQAQRSMFQLLDVHVTLSYDGQQRWADVTCSLGSERCAVGYNSSWSTARKSVR